MEIRVFFSLSSKILLLSRRSLGPVSVLFLFCSRGRQVGARATDGRVSGKDCQGGKIVLGEGGLILD